MKSDDILQFIRCLNEEEKRDCQFPAGTLRVNLKTLENNLLRLREHAGKARLLLPIKANAYGHGMLAIARFTESRNLCEYFGVACLQEALRLRQAGIISPILILGQSPIDSATTQAIVANNIEQAISEPRLLQTLDDEAEKQNKTACIHLAIDTGMGRGGVLPEHLDELLAQIKKCEHIKLAGVMTHFSVADETDEASLGYTRKQIDIFKKAKSKITEVFPGQKILYHAANSGGTISQADGIFDMIRPGIAAYGYPEPDTGLGLYPVMELTAKIALIKKFPVGHDIGYGRTYATDDEQDLAIIPIGYGDGLFRG